VKGGDPSSRHIGSKVRWVLGLPAGVRNWSVWEELHTPGIRSEVLRAVVQQQGKQSTLSFSAIGTKTFLDK
jgi:hypothetical protein